MSGSAVADIRDTYGATFIGLFISSVLYGVTLTQMWTYYRQYGGRDSIRLKGFVVLLFILDTLHTVLSTYSVYWYLILNFGNVANLDMNMWAMNTQADVNALIGFSVQLFYARRLYLMSRSVVVPVIIVMLGGICFVLGFVFTAKSFELKRYSRYSSLTWVICTGMGSAALADIAIAVAMCWYLHHKRTGFQRTDSIIMTLISHSIKSGLVTSILATGMLVCFLALRSTLTWQVLFWLMGKCYVNSFLSMLNNRDALRDWSANEQSLPAVDLSTQGGGRSYKCRTGPPAVAVSVHQTITSDFETRKRDYDDDAPELENSCTLP